MSNLVIILGASGTGKSTSIKTLNPQETVVLNVLGKDLPFKGSRTNYTREKLNNIQPTNWENVQSMMQSISKNKPDIKNIIIDDAIYIMRTEFFDRSREKGFDKYNELADHFRRIVAESSNLRSDITVFMMLHIEAIEADGSIIGYKPSTVGKLLDKMYNPIESVSINLFSQPQYDDKGRPTFGFYTHPMKVNGIEIPAKSPDGMFDSDFIPNDLQLVVDKMKEYYGG